MGQTLEKLGTSNQKPSTQNPFINIVRTVVQNQSRSPFRFLFLGETGAGKTSTIANLFKLERPAHSQSTDFIQIWKTGNSLEVIELPGLLQTGSLEEDAPTLAGLLLFLRQYFTREIPTLIFVTARISDSRFEGISSNFSMVLHGVKLLLPEISDAEYSNVILLLSNGRGIDNELDLRISRYQAAFHQIIQMDKSIPCLAVDKDTAMDDFRQILEMKAAPFSPVQDFLSEYVSSQRTNQQFTYEGKTLKELKTDEFWALQRKILNYIISDEFLHMDMLASDDHNVEDKTCGCDRETVPFCSYIHISSPGEGYEPILPNCKILMADGFQREIESCRVGQKVTSLSHKSGIITGIRETAVPKGGIMVNMYKTKGIEKDKFKHLVKKMGKSESKRNRSSKRNDLEEEKDIRQTLIKLYNSDVKNSCFWTYNMNGDRFELVQIKCESLLQEVECLFFIEVDNGDGTFVADGIVRACTKTNVIGTRL